jgi:hypothetical protein
MFTIATVRHSGSHIVQSIELGRGMFFFRSTPPASWGTEEVRREVSQEEARGTLLVWRDLASEGGELTVLSEDQLLLESYFGARHLEMLVGEAPQQEPDEEHIPNEEGVLPAAFDPEAQADLELHEALHPAGYRGEGL